MPAHKRKPSVLRDLVAGSAAGICSIFVCHPFDVIRVRLQTDAGAHAANKIPVREYGGAVDCFKQAIKKEGTLALYRGLAMPLAAQAVYKSVIFGTFSATSQLAIKFNTNTNRNPELSRWQVALCGACAGAVNAFVVCPVELARNRLVLERQTCPEKMRHKGPVDVLQHVRRTEGGLPALFQGLGVTIMRDALGIAVYFSVFRLLHPYTQDWLGVGDMRASLLAGGMAGVSFWAVALPLDAIKTVRQTDAMLLPYAGESEKPRDAKATATATAGGKGGGGVVKQRGIWEIGRQMAKEKSLYRGWALAFSRGVPSAAIVFSVQERVRDMLEDV